MKKSELPVAVPVYGDECIRAASISSKRQFFVRDPAVWGMVTHTHTHTKTMLVDVAAACAGVVWSKKSNAKKCKRKKRTDERAAVATTALSTHSFIQSVRSLHWPPSASPS